MEFFQFHPTGIYKLGILITEGVRGEGGVLINGKGERFMPRYAPHVKDLASRDVISRAIYTEIREGRGVDGKNYVWLDARPESVIEVRGRGRAQESATAHPTRITAEQLLKKLPDIVDFNRVYLGIDPMTEMMPIQPTAHYTMGGIPTNKYGEVVVDDKNTVFPGLYAAGECACVSRARRQPAGNQFPAGPDRVREAFRHAGGGVRQSGGIADLFLPTRLPKRAVAIAALRGGAGKENAFDIATELKNVMFEDVGIYRNEKDMRTAIERAGGAAAALQGHPHDGHGRDLQHRVDQRLGAGQHARDRRGHRQCALNRRNPRRALARGLPEARRPELAEAHAGLAQGRQSGARLQAGGDHEVPAEGTGVLRLANVDWRLLRSLRSRVGKEPLPAERNDVRITGDRTGCR